MADMLFLGIVGMPDVSVNGGHAVSEYGGDGRCGVDGRRVVSEYGGNGRCGGS